MMSGTKSVKLTIMQKYQDILSRLKDLDNCINNEADDEFKKLRVKNTEEYDEICKCIKMYEGIEIEDKSDSEISNKSDPIVPKRNTIAGRKTVSKLPDNCGVKIEDIPKYCWYKAATKTSYEKFIIDRHPKLLEQGKRQWSTAEFGETTLDKFNMMIEKYEELST
jgi:Zn-dependent metalloprotease